MWNLCFSNALNNTVDIVTLISPPHSSVYLQTIYTVYSLSLSICLPPSLPVCVHRSAHRRVSCTASAADSRPAVIIGRGRHTGNATNSDEAEAQQDVTSSQKWGLLSKARSKIAFTPDTCSRVIIIIIIIRQFIRRRNMTESLQGRRIQVSRTSNFYGLHVDGGTRRRIQVLSSVLLADTSEYM